MESILCKGYDGIGGAMMGNDNFREFFIRHSSVLEISSDDIKMIQENGIVGIHYGSNYENCPDELKDINSIAYGNDTAKSAMKRFIELGKTGGFVWADYYNLPSVIGYIEPGSKLKLMRFTPVKNQDSFTNPEGALYLKYYKLEDLRIIQDQDLLSFRARRPRQGTFVKWHASDGRLKKFINGNLSLEEWKDLSPDQQEIVVFEYLKDVGVSGYRIKRLLMPIGRTLKDVDIYGLGESGNKIFVQVTYRGKKEKVDALNKYCGRGNAVIYVGGDEYNEDRDEIIFLHWKKVFLWLKKDAQSSFLNALKM